MSHLTRFSYTSQNGDGSLPKNKDFGKFLPTLVEHCFKGYLNAYGMQLLHQGGGRRSVECL
jgi:hypothetical protein